MDLLIKGTPMFQVKNCLAIVFGIVSIRGCIELIGVSQLCRSPRRPTSVVTRGASAALRVASPGRLRTGMAGSQALPWWSASRLPKPESTDHRLLRVPDEHAGCVVPAQQSTTLPSRGTSCHRTRPVPLATTSIGGSGLNSFDQSGGQLANRVFTRGVRGQWIGVEGAGDRLNHHLIDVEPIGQLEDLLGDSVRLPDEPRLAQ